MSKIIVSNEISEIVINLRKFGYEAIFSDNLTELLPFEKNHADIQCLKINKRFFVLRNCKKLYDVLVNEKLDVTYSEAYAKEKYPDNVLLNCLYIKNMLLCREKSLDLKVKEFCNANNIKIIDVKQGYTKCSTAVIDDKFITSDVGIYNTLQKSGVEGLLIDSGDIELNGVDYGFIGGCCFSDEYNVYFTGNITKHRNYNLIKDFCYKQNKNIICLSNNKLYDIGGFIVI